MTGSRSSLAHRDHLIAPARDEAIAEEIQGPRSWRDDRYGCTLETRRKKKHEVWRDIGYFLGRDTNQSAGVTPPHTYQQRIMPERAEPQPLSRAESRRKAMAGVQGIFDRLGNLSLDPSHQSRQHHSPPLLLSPSALTQLISHTLTNLPATASCRPKWGRPLIPLP